MRLQKLVTKSGDLVGKAASAMLVKDNRAAYDALNDLDDLLTDEICRMEIPKRKLNKSTQQDLTKISQVC